MSEARRRGAAGARLYCRQRSQTKDDADEGSLTVVKGRTSGWVGKAQGGVNEGKAFVVTDSTVTTCVYIYQTYWGKIKILEERVAIADEGIGVSQLLGERARAASPTFPMPMTMGGDFGRTGRRSLQNLRWGRP